jgi:glycyl-tRNA synthetase
MAFLIDAYDEEVVGQDKNGRDDVRTVLRLHPALPPINAPCAPEQEGYPGGAARKLQQALSKRFMTDYDDSGSIGKRYRRQDEVGTPFCVTVDFRPWATARFPPTAA